MPIERPNRDALEAYTDQAIEDTEKALEEDRAELARQEALANKPWYESLWDETKNTAEWAYDEAGKAWDFVSATANDVLDAYYKLGAEREAFLKRGADLQQAYSPEAVAEAQETGDYSAQQQAFASAQEQAAETQTAMANVPRSFVRQAARTLIETYDDTDDDGAFGSLIESIKQSDANIEYFMTDAEKLQKARDIEAATGIKAEAFLGDTKAYKQAMEIYDFKRKLEKAGGDPDKIYEEYPELKSIVDMDPASAAIALHELESIKSTHGTIETFDYMLQQGRLQLEYDNLMYKVAMGKATENDLQRANDLKWQIENSQKKTPSFLDDPLAAIAAGIAGSTPGMYQAIMEGLEDFAITEAAFTQAGAAAGAAVGGVGAAPGAAAGASAGVVKSVIASIAKNSARRELVEAGARQFLTGQVARSGSSLAFKLGMFSGMQRQMVGESFSDYKDLKDENGNPLLSNEAARNYALASGSAQAGIEMMNFGLIKNALIGRPHANKIIGDIVSDAQSKMVARESARNIFRQKVGDTLKITASEAGEEGLQSIADDLVHNQIAADTQAKTVKPYSAQDILTRAAASAAMAIPASIGFGLMGTTGGSVTNTIRNNRAQKKLAQFQALYGDNARQTLVGTLMMEQLQQTVAESNLAKNSPDIQTKVLREQLKQTQFQTSYIDVEMALKKENGMNDLKEVAKAANLSNEELQTAIDQKGHILVPSETLAQVKASPELLDAVSFDAAAPSMARMRETSKEVMQEVEKRTEKAINKQVELINGIVNKYYPTDDKGRQNASQRDMMTAAIYTNINNPAAGWKALRKEQQDQLDAILAPAIKALEDGFGKAGLGEIEDEQGNKKTVYTSDNDQWYRDWYKEHEHQPTKKELQDMAIAMVTGDPSAPKVQGWVPTTAEEQAAFEANRADVEKLKQDIDILDEIKGNMKELTGVEMRLTEGLSAEGYDVYRQVYDYLKKIRGGVAVQARMGALLTARHADIYAAIISKQTGKKYTAMDYMRDTLGFDTKPSEGGLKQMAGVKAQNAPIVDLRRAQEMERNGKTPEEVYDKTGWVKGKDGKWRFEIPDNLDKINWNGINDYASIWQVYDNERLYRAYPWLSSIPVKLVNMEEGNKGRVTGNVYRFIEINRNISDEEKSKTLIHEIQHMIQEKEGFAAGGNIQQVRRQIQGQIESIRQKLTGIPQAEEYIRASRKFFAALENGSKENMDKVWEEQSRLEEEIPEATRNEIDNLSVQLDKLENALQSGSDYFLYMNLAGEQEARSTASRAKYMTEYRRAIQEETKAQLAYEQEVKKQPREMLDKLRELQQLENKIGNGITEEEDDRREELRREIDKKMLEAYDNRDDANWMVADKKEYLNMPMPHNENALVVFDGQEYNAEQEPVVREVFIDGAKYAIKEYATGVVTNGKTIENKSLVTAIRMLENIGNVDKVMEILDVASKSHIKGKARAAKEALDFLQGKDIKINTVKLERPKQELPIKPPALKDEEVEEIRKTYGPFDGEGYNPRSKVPKVRGGWTEKKILRYLKAHGTPHGVRDAVRLIAEFDSVEELKSHMFFHGSPGGASALKPSITMSKREIERVGGGGYGERYWGISVTPNKKIASNFSGDKSHINIYPIILAKNAIVEENPKLKDAEDIEPQIVDYWTRGVDAVWIGDKNAGEQELLVLNPRAIVNLDKADTYQVFKLGTKENPLTIKNDEEIAKMLNVAKSLRGKKGDYKYDSQETRNTIFFQTAWHGTPHDFEKFDLGSIGTGEGAAVHGWGLYFAGNRSVAEGYKSRLARQTNADNAKGKIGNENYYRKGKVWKDSKNNNASSAVTYILNSIENEYGLPNDKKRTNKKEWSNSIRFNAEGLEKYESSKERAKELKEAADIFDANYGNIEFTIGGKLFEVEIPDDDVLLDEQKPFDEQSPKVQAALKDMYDDLIPRKIGTLNEFHNGKDVYNDLMKLFQDKRLASETLNEYGIKGITYEGGQDGRCFVVFDDKAISVIERYNQTAWHGTPHDFEKFDIGAIGTGEGTQARGWGIYSAADKKIAQKYYRERLVKPGWSKLEKWLNKNLGMKVGNQGKLFEVEVPDYDVMLDLDKSFEEQPKLVKERIAEAWKKENKKFEELSPKMQASIKWKLRREAERKLKELWGEYQYYYAEIALVEGNMSGAARDKAVKKYEQELKKLDEKIEKTKADKYKNIAQETKEWYKHLTGEEIYEFLSKEKGGDKKASLYLNSLGIKGNTYEGGRDGRCFVIFDDKAISIIRKYNQMVAEKNQDETLGFTKFYQDGRRIVSILENANESTFVHELGHVFLDDLQKLAEIDETSAKELEIVNAWAEWHKGDAEKYRPTSSREKSWYKEFKQREQDIIDAEAAGDYDAADKLKREWKHERFARAFELYLRDGQAPAKGLKEVFRKFKTFLKQVYVIFTADGARASEPVKRVMDRMIASEEEIEQASLEDRYKDITAAGGSKLLEETEEKTYKRFYKEAEAESKEKLMAIVMDDLEDARKAEFDRRIMSEEARKRKELQQETVYLAEQAVLLSGGNEDIVTEWYPSVEDFRKELAETKPLEDALKEWMDKYKDELDAELIESHFSEENIEKCMQKPKYREKMEVLKATALTKKFSLINSINAKAKTAIGSIEDKLMAMPDDIDLKVDKSSDSVKGIMKAINELRFAARWTPSEYRHIESMIRANTQEDIRQALKAFKEQAKENKENEQAVLKANEGKMQLYKELAKSSIMKKNLADACNYGYYVREQKIQARRVQQMINAKRFDMAIQAQQQQAFAAAMANESKKMQEKVQKLLNAVKRQLNTRSVRLPKDERYWHRHLSYILRLTNKDAKKPESGVMKLEDIFSSMKESLDLQYSPIDIMEISAEDEDFKGYKSLTFDQFEDAVEALTVLYTTGRDKFRMKTIGGRDIADVVQEIILGSGIKDRVRTTRDIINDDAGGLGYNGWLGKIPGIGQAMAERGQKYLAVMLKPEEILKALGPAAHKYIFGIYDKAREAENKMIMEEMRVMRDILKDYSEAEKRAWKKKNIKFRTGQTERLISKENVICMALNMGNKANIQRICGGFGTDIKEIESFLQEHMTKKDWELVQNIWDHLNSYWEQTVEVEEKLNGVALQKVEAVPFTAKTKDGEEIKLNGGYYPIKYNPKKSSKAEEQDINKAAMGVMSGAQVLGTNRGFTKSRADVDINRPILLEFGVITEHLQNVIHNINFRIPARDVYRLVNSQAFEDHVRNTLGAPYHTLLKQWATDVWNQPKDQSNMAGSFADELLGFLRRNAVMSIMGYRLWPVIENISNIAPAMDQLGAAKALAAISKFYANYEDSKGILKKSIFMMNRINSMDRDISAQEGLFEVGLPVFDIIKRHAYDMMLYSDLMISAPLWVQSYKDAFPVKVDEVRRETQANIKALHDAQMAVDEIKAAINDAEKEAAEIDNHMSIRESGTPDQIEQEKLSPFALHKPVELRAMSHERRNQAFEKRKELYKAEDKLNRAMELDIYSDDESIKEAEKRAVAAADAVIRDTFGSGATMDLSSLQRNKNEMVKLMTTFYSFFNTQFNAIYRDYTRGKFGSEEINAIRRWAPFAKKIMYRIILVSLIGSLLKFALGVDGNDDRDKYITVKDANGKEKKVEIPAFQRFLNVFGKNMLSTAAGGLVGVRDAANMAINYLFDGTNYGRSFNPVSAGFRSVEEFGKMFDLLARKGKKDLEIQEQEEKREREWKARLKKLKGKKRTAAIKKHEEDEKYRKPVKRITYSEVARHGMTGLSSITASYTGLTSTMVDSITGTMQYLNDTDGRYDPTWKNIIWSALFDKKPVERVVPEKPPAPPKPAKKRRRKKGEKNN